MVTQAAPTHRFTQERLGISLVFLVSGLWFASWAGRLSVISDVFSFSGTGLGTFLACLTAGSLMGLGLAPTLIRKVSTRRMLTFLPLALAFGLIALGLAVSIVRTPEIAYLTLFFSGIIFGILDVTMNVYGAGVERRIGHSILPSLHGFFSLGTLLGAGFATLTITWQWYSFWHFGVVALVLCALAIWSVRLLSYEAKLGAKRLTSTPKPTGASPKYMLLLLGLMVAGLSFTEGAANDWLAVASHDGHGLPHSTGALMFTVFVAAMTIGRFGGGTVVDKLGAVRALLLLGTFGLVGVVLFITGTSVALIAVGALLWGLGSSLGFPVGMSIAASRSEKLGSRAVSIISTFGYAAMLGGPPVIGFLADFITVLPALWLAAAVLVVSLLITPFAGRTPRVSNTKPARSSAP
ncbi:MFS transporter [Glutamicibacter uratoxydans]|uniref:MFS transporter n=1 Tax=Glutamicibacter uratoxydans TaxID=43667 RepID=UPI003D6E2975